MPKNFAVTENTPIAVVLERAGVPPYPPAALGRTSWVDVLTVGQLSEALSRKAQQGGAALGRRSWLENKTTRQLSAALRGKAEPQPQPFTPSSPERRAEAMVVRPSHDPTGGFGPPVQQQKTTDRAKWSKEQEDWKQQQEAWERLSLWEQLVATLRSERPPLKKELSPKLAALQAMIDAILAAMDRALLSFDLITYAVLFGILMRLRDEYNRELARLGTAYEPAHETAQERGR